MKIILAILLFALPLLGQALKPAVGPSPTKLNGLEQRKGKDLAAELTRHNAEVTSLTQQQANLQAKVTAATDPKLKAQLQTRLDQTTKQLAASQKAQTSAGMALSDWTTKTLATHQAAAGSSIDWTHATIAPK